MGHKITTFLIILGLWIATPSCEIEDLRESNDTTSKTVLGDPNASDATAASPDDDTNKSKGENDQDLNDQEPQAQSPEPVNEPQNAEPAEDPEPENEPAIEDEDKEADEAELPDELLDQAEDGGLTIGKPDFDASSTKGEDEEKDEEGNGDKDKEEKDDDDADKAAKDVTKKIPGPYAKCEGLWTLDDTWQRASVDFKGETIKHVKYKDHIKTDVPRLLIIDVKANKKVKNVNLELMNPKGKYCLYFEGGEKLKSLNIKLHCTAELGHLDVNANVLKKIKTKQKQCK